MPVVPAPVIPLSLIVVTELPSQQRVVALVPALVLVGFTAEGIRRLVVVAAGFLFPSRDLRIGIVGYDLDHRADRLGYHGVDVVRLGRLLASLRRLRVGVFRRLRRGDGGFEFGSELLRLGQRRPRGRHVPRAFARHGLAPRGVHRARELLDRLRGRRRGGVRRRSARRRCRRRRRLGGVGASGDVLRSAQGSLGSVDVAGALEPDGLALLLEASVAQRGDLGRVGYLRGGGRRRGCPRPRLCLLRASFGLLLGQQRGHQHFPFVGFLLHRHQVPHQRRFLQRHLVGHVCNLAHQPPLELLVCLLSLGMLGSLLVVLELGE
mmetsp:Transcript_13007/g.56562  ORF Transcript_13007/g.56562 Transcript_13007/m.56562 type:complete len:321 (+) Transcript_13007:3340-4302(+)